MLCSSHNWSKWNLCTAAGSLQMADISQANCAEIGLTFGGPQQQLTTRLLFSKFHVVLRAWRLDLSSPRITWFRIDKPCFSQPSTLWIWVRCGEACHMLFSTAISNFADVGLRVRSLLTSPSNALFLLCCSCERDILHIQYWAVDKLVLDLGIIRTYIWVTLELEAFCGQRGTWRHVGSLIHLAIISLELASLVAGTSQVD